MLMPFRCLFHDAADAAIDAAAAACRHSAETMPRFAYAT